MKKERVEYHIMIPYGIKLLPLWLVLGLVRVNLLTRGLERNGGEFALYMT